ncbi:LAME_0C04962g1_1 [Lachancea meyersii CBS 8951]|uniref:LAME_0C04962g1_1 n=1 Tax=Lachancea meyersii CBS 8951 TaxID=1266667 RepID=A0A1G4J205_9SACH|nr:LAME_0C04962g1_1 [Lachancea meyersii CBS 8951]
MSSMLSTCCVVILSIVVMVLNNNKSIKMRLASKLQHSLSKLNRHVPISTDFKLGNTEHFKTAVGLADVYDSLLHLQEYRVRALNQNAALYHLSKTLDPTQIEQLRALQYYEKLEQVNDAVGDNSKTAQLIVENSLNKLLLNNRLDDENGKEALSVFTGLGYERDGESALKRIPVHKLTLAPNSNQQRVNEAISHMCRDWHHSFEAERKPLVDFMVSRVKGLNLKGNTLLVVPGSGAGRLAYEIARAFPKCDVHSVELSTLMYLCNEFALDHSGTIRIAPFAQHFSGQLTTRQQVGGLDIDLAQSERPSNLKVHLGNFCEFQPCASYDNIVVLSAYFIDTAEDLFDYFEAIEALKTSCSKLHWVNIGPLKYGTRPKVQFTVEELTKLRSIRKWKDLYHDANTDKLCGYLTNKDSLYQGFYGLVRFHSQYTGE